METVKTCLSEEDLRTALTVPWTGMLTGEVVSHESKM